MKFSNNKIALATILALSLIACSPNKSTDEYISSAQTLIAQNKINAAIIELKNAIKVDPKNVNIRLALGKIYLKQGDLLSSIKELQKALQNGGDINEIIPLLANAYQQNNNETDLLALEENLPELNEASKLQFYVYCSILYSQQKKIDKAKEYLSKATTLSEDNVYSRLANAWFNKSQQKIDDALSIISSIEVENSKKLELSEINLLKGHLLFAKKQYKEASKNYLAYVNNHPKNYQVKIFLANSYIAAGENNKANQLVTALLKTFPKHPYINQLMAQLKYSQGDYSDAKQFANVALQATELPMAKLILGLSAYQLKEYEQAYQSLRTVAPDLPTNHPVHELLLALQLRLGYSNEAAQSFQDLNKYAVGDEKFLQNASMAFSRAGKDKIANQLVDKAIELTPNDADLVMQKGMLQLKEQDKAGMDLLEKALKLNPELKTANITLAMQYVDQKKYDKALEIAKKWQQTKSGKIQGQLLEGVIYTSQQNFTKAKVAFNTVLKMDDTSVPANYYLGLLVLNEKKFDQALSQFEKVLKQSPAHFGALQNIIWVAIASSNQEKVNSFFIKLRKEFPQQLSLVLAQAVNISNQGDVQGAIDFLNKYRESDFINNDYWFALADLYKKNNQSNKAKEIYQELVMKNPNSLQIRLALIETFAEEKNYSAIVTQVNNVLSFAPENLKFKVIKAKYLLKLNQLDEAKRLLDNISKELPDNIDVSRLMADYQYRKGNYQQAVIILEKVYTKNKSEHYLMEFVKALRANKQNDKALNELEAFLKNSKHKNTLAKVAYAQLLLKNNPKKALLEYYDLLKNMPDNVVLLNNTALTELSLNLIDKAMLHAKKAVTLAPKKAAIIDTYAQVLMKDKQVEQASKHFEVAHKLAKTNDEIFIHYAQSLAELGQLQQLKRLLSQYSLTDKQYEFQLQQLNNLINK